MVTVVSPTANPTPLKATHWTCHMVAPISFLNLALAFGAERDTEISIRPFVELFFKIFLTRCKSTMIFFFAFKANASLTFWAFNLPDTEIFSFYIALATWFDTKSDKGIVLKFFLFFEAKIFLNDLFILIEDHFYLSICHLGVAIGLAAF